MRANRIALFQYEWPLQVHTVNLAVKLAECGFAVDIFLHDCSTDFIGDEDLLKNDAITIVDLPVTGDGGFRQSFSKIMRRINAMPGETSSILPELLKKSADYIDKNSYRCFIGIEKKGLIWAGMLAQKYRVPYLYYSLELYLEDHPAFANDEEFARVRREEIEYHRTSRATIIQDKMRAKVLLASNGIDRTDLLFLPVSLPEGENRDKSNWLYDQNWIPLDKKIILYFGLIGKDRLCGEMAEIAGRLKNDFIMVIHGFGSEDEIEPLRDKENLVLSLNFIDQHDIKKLIASAAIGLVVYGDTCSNDRLTAFASEKLALYLQSGIPIIAFDRGNYRELMNAYRCGVLIDDMKELPDAAEEILKDYERYRTEAFAAYRELYSYGKYFQTIQEYLSVL